MLLLISILLISAIAVFIVVFSIVSNIKKEERDKYYAAAGNILKESFLNYSLQNNFIGGEDLKEPSLRKTMIYLKLKGSKQKLQFVFDPEKTVLFGRDKSRSNIYLNEAVISQEHCLIYSKNDNVFIRDMNSANGTVVKRGLFKKFFIVGQSFLQLKTGDKIIVGSNTFKVILFYYDMALM